jgi:hypothetical protein
MEGSQSEERTRSNQIGMHERQWQDWQLNLEIPQSEALHELV